jgi:hypothetical protein
MRMKAVRRYDRNQGRQTRRIEDRTQVDDRLLVRVAQIRTAHRVTVPLADVGQKATGALVDVIEHLG